jgi:hypothetical protein
MGGSFALCVVGSTDAGPTEESHCPWVSSAPIAQPTTADNERLAFDATPPPAYLDDRVARDGARKHGTVWLAESGESPGR